MNLPIQPVSVPLAADEAGGLRVGGSRVLLENIVHAFEQGATPEGIVQSYDTLELSDVYAVLTWYLQHRRDVDDYLSRRAREAAQIRQGVEVHQPPRSDLRARLIARQATQESADAAAPE
jgi:uncharacterized protein (DUF433 family)